MKVVTVRYDGKKYKACPYDGRYIIIGMAGGWMPRIHWNSSIKAAVPIKYHEEPCWFVSFAEVISNKIYLGGE